MAVYGEFRMAAVSLKAMHAGQGSILIGLADLEASPLRLVELT